MYLDGITIANALVTSLGNNQHRVSYCVHLPGNYKLHIRLLLINGWAGFDRALWGSPFSIQVTDPQELVIPTSLAPVRASELPVCVNAYDASYGEWVRVDALSVAERHAWHSTVLRATRDDYVWAPYLCRLLPMDKTQIRHIYTSIGQTCLMGDSLLRSLFAYFLFWSGIYDVEGLHKTGYTQTNWQLEGFNFFWWESEANQRQFGDCVVNASLVVRSFIEDMQAIPLTEADLNHMLDWRGKMPDQTVPFVQMLAHYQTGDRLEAAHRNNRNIQQRNREQRALLKGQSDGMFDIFDVSEMHLPRMVAETCDGMHVMCGQGSSPNWIDHQVVGHWEGLILAQILTQVPT